MSKLGESIVILPRIPRQIALVVPLVSFLQEPLPDCEWCGADEAPEDLNWHTTITGPEELGERLVITGTVYQNDGTTPAPDVIIYAYHTNQRGIYARRGDETGNGRRHGYLRGWLLTDKNGRYRIDTIRPGTYPTGTEPAHIHLTIKEPHKPEYWIDSIMFEDDPLLTERRRRAIDRRGGSGIISLQKSEEGVWTGIRDIVLEP